MTEQLDPPSPSPPPQTSTTSTTGPRSPISSTHSSRSQYLTYSPYLTPSRSDHFKSPSQLAPVLSATLLLLLLTCGCVCSVSSSLSRSGYGGPGWSGRAGGRGPPGGDRPLPGTPSPRLALSPAGRNSLHARNDPPRPRQPRDLNLPDADREDIGEWSARGLKSELGAGEEKPPTLRVTTLQDGLQRDSWRSEYTGGRALRPGTSPAPRPLPDASTSDRKVDGARSVPQNAGDRRSELLPGGKSPRVGNTDYLLHDRIQRDHLLHDGMDTGGRGLRASPGTLGHLWRDAAPLRRDNVQLRTDGPAPLAIYTPYRRTPRSAGPAPIPHKPSSSLSSPKTLNLVKPTHNRKFKPHFRRKGKGKRQRGSGRKSSTMETPGERSSRRRTLVPPKFMLDLYYTYTEGQSRPADGSVVRGFIPTSTGPLVRSGSTGARRLRFDLSSVPPGETVTGAELRLYLLTASGGFPTGGRGASRAGRGAGRRGRRAPTARRVCVLRPPAARPLHCRSARRAARLGWETYNVTDAVLHWRDAGRDAGGGVSGGCSGQQELEVRLETLEDGGGTNALKDALPLKDAQETPLQLETVPTSGRRDAASPSRGPPPLLDFGSAPSRPALLPLLVVYSEEPQNATTAADAAAIDGQEPEDDDDETQAEVFTVGEKNNGGRPRTHRKYSGGRFRRAALPQDGAVIDDDGLPVGGAASSQTTSSTSQTGVSLHSMTPRSKVNFNVKVNSSSSESAMFDDRNLSQHRRRRKYSLTPARKGRRKRMLPGSGRSGKRPRAKRGKSRRRSRRQCRKVPMYVSFAEINWHKWVIAPKGYEAYQCTGRCDFPLSDHLTPTKHAIVQSLLHVNAPDRTSRACCVPTRLDPVSILYVDDRNVVTYKYRYHGMRVGECGCR